MTDEELERGIEAIQAMLGAREAGVDARSSRGCATGKSQTSDIGRPPTRKRSRGFPSLPHDADVTNSVDASGG